MMCQFKKQFRSVHLAVRAVFGFAVVAPVAVVAQEPPVAPATPGITAMDANDVDLMSGFTKFSLTDLQIGSGASPLVHTLLSVPNGFYEHYLQDNFTAGIGGLNSDQWIFLKPTKSVDTGGGGERFYSDNGVFVSAEAQGSTLIDNGATYTYTRHDGVVFTIDKAHKGNIQATMQGVVTHILEPSGRSTTITYRKITMPWVGGTTTERSRIQSVTRSDGLQLKYTYALNTIPDVNTLKLWKRTQSITAINNAIEYCDPAADACSLSGPWPTTTYSWGTPPSGVGKTLTATDADGRATRYTMDVYERAIAIKPATSATDRITYEYCSRTPPWTCYVSDANGMTTPIFDLSIKSTREGQDWTYWFNQNIAGHYSEYRSNSPTGTFKVAVKGLDIVGPLITVTTDDGTIAGFDTTSFANQLISVRSLEGNLVRYTRDPRGNIVEVKSVPKSASGMVDMVVQTAGFDATCTYPAKCNKPNWIKDGRLNQTDLTYDNAHGGLLTTTGPAVNGVRPQKRYTYSQRRAWVRNASGSYVPLAPMWVLSQESYCRTGAAAGAGCVAANDEVVTTYDYGPDSGPNNLFLRGMALTADGQTLRTCYRYDSRGNRISETSPRAGLGSCP